MYYFCDYRKIKDFLQKDTQLTGICYCLQGRQAVASEWRKKVLFIAFFTKITFDWSIVAFQCCVKFLLLLLLSRFSRVQLIATPWSAAHQAPPSIDFPGKSTGMGCHCLLCVLVSTLQQSESAVCIRISPLFWTLFPLGHNRAEWSSLSYTIRVC